VDIVVFILRRHFCGCDFSADPNMTKNLALGVSIPVHEAIFACRRNPSPSWPESVYQIIGKACYLYNCRN